MQKLITLSIIAGLAVTTPAIVLTQNPATAQTAPTQFRGLDFYASEFMIVNNGRNTAKVNLNIRNRTNNSRTLTSSEGYALRSIRMVDGRTGKSYGISNVEGDDDTLDYGGDTIKYKMTFDLPQGIWPTHLELDNDTEQPIKIRL